MTSREELSQMTERLQQAMENSKLSYGEIATITNIPKSAVHRYISGETPKIPLDRLNKIANALGVSATWIMGWESEKENEKQNRPSPDKIILTEGERLVLDLFNEVPEEQQPMVIEMIRAALKMRK